MHSGKQVYCSDLLALVSLGALAWKGALHDP